MFSGVATQRIPPMRSEASAQKGGMGVPPMFERPNTIINSSSRPTPRLAALQRNALRRCAARPPFALAPNTPYIANLFAEHPLPEQHQNRALIGKTFRIVNRRLNREWSGPFNDIAKQLLAENLSISATFNDADSQVLAHRVAATILVAIGEENRTLVKNIRQPLKTISELPQPDRRVHVTSLVHNLAPIARSGFARYMASAGVLALFQILIDLYPRELAQTDKFGMCPVSWAASFGATEIVRLGLTRGLSPATTNLYSWTLADLAFANKHTDLGEELLRAGAPPRGETLFQSMKYHAIKFDD